MESTDEHAKKIINRYEEIWMGLDGVTSVGLGKTAEGAASIIISLEQDTPSTRDIFPVEIEGIPLQFKICGKTEPL